MARIVVGSPNLTQPLLLYPGLGPAMLEQHRRSLLFLITATNFPFGFSGCFGADMYGEVDQLLIFCIFQIMFQLRVHTK
jgi:hypothetical protein